MNYKYIRTLLEKYTSVNNKKRVPSYHPCYGYVETIYVGTIPISPINTYQICNLSSVALIHTSLRAKLLGRFFKHLHSSMVNSRLVQTDLPGQFFSLIRLSSYPIHFPFLWQVSPNLTFLHQSSQTQNTSILVSCFSQHVGLSSSIRTRNNLNSPQDNLNSS